MESSPPHQPLPPSQPPLAPQLPPQPNPSLSPPPAAKAGSRLAGARAFLSVLAFVGGIIITATLINQFVFQSYYVDGTSMVPTLNNNDRLIINKVDRTLALVSGKHYIPQRGQIVVLDSSLVDQTGHNEQLIKRVIGLPGDTIIIDDGIVTIRNQEHPEGFNVNETLGLTQLESTYIDAPLTVTIPANQVFVMGDNRAPGGSLDSRSFGPVQSDKIQGRLVARIFPLNQTKVF